MSGRTFPPFLKRLTSPVFSILHPPHGKKRIVVVFKLVELFSTFSWQDKWDCRLIGIEFRSVACGKTAFFEAWRKQAICCVAYREGQLVWRSHRHQPKRQGEGHIDRLKDQAEQALSWHVGKYGPDACHQ